MVALEILIKINTNFRSIPYCYKQKNVGKIDFFFFNKTNFILTKLYKLLQNVNFFFKSENVKPNEQYFFSIKKL